jgi:hypothetical protein
MRQHHGRIGLSSRLCQDAFCCFLHFAQRTFCAARIRAKAAGNLRFFTRPVVPDGSSFTFAQRERWPSAPSAQKPRWRNWPRSCERGFFVGSRPCVGWRKPGLRVLGGQC